MKKIILAILCTILVLTMSGCFNQGPQYENLDTTQAPDPDTIKMTDYGDNLDGLVKYFKALGYLPTNTEPTVMLAEVIGAKKGYRYIYTVDNSNVVTELYEYDPSYSDPNAARVTTEIKETGAFHLFNQEGVDTDTTYKATLSDNGKYMMIYGDTSTNTGNVARTKLVEVALKGFYSDESKSKETSETSKPAEESKTSDTSDTSKSADESKTSEASETSKSADESKTSDTSDASKAA